MWNGNSVQVGTFSTGAVGSPGYSLDIGQFCTGGSCSAPFDLLIQYGDASVDTHSESGYSTTDGGFINNGPQLGKGRTTGEHGVWGSVTDNPNGYYASFCAYAGSCGTTGNDFWQFSTNGVYPSGSAQVPCGFYSYRGTSWKNCGSGDNSHRMRYYIRSPDLGALVNQIPPKPGQSEFIGCFVDDGNRDLGPNSGPGSKIDRRNAATNTFALCRAACGTKTYMSLQYGGECFCGNSYGTGEQYIQTDESECNMVFEPCSSNSFLCGSSWRQAIYKIN